MYQEPILLTAARTSESGTDNSVSLKGREIEELLASDFETKKQTAAKTLKDFCIGVPEGAVFLKPAAVRAAPSIVFSSIRT